MATASVAIKFVVHEVDGDVAHGSPQSHASRKKTLQRRLRAYRVVRLVRLQVASSECCTLCTRNGAAPTSRQRLWPTCRLHEPHRMRASIVNMLERLRQRTVEDRAVQFGFLANLELALGLGWHEDTILDFDIINRALLRVLEVVPLRRRLAFNPEGARVYLLRLHLDLHDLVRTLAASQAQLRLPSQAARQIRSLLKHRQRIADSSMSPRISTLVAHLFRIVHSHFWMINYGSKM